MRHTAINPWRWQEPLGFAQGVLVDQPRRWLVCAGQTSVDDSGRVRCPGDLAGQLDAALDNLAAVLGEAGFELADVVRLTIYVTDVGAYFAAQQAFVDCFAAKGIPVASTLIGVTALAMPELLVELEATAAR